MNTKQLVGLTTLLAMTSGITQATPLGMAFTYQGRLNDGAVPAQGSYDLRFTLYDDLNDGAAVGGPLTNSATGVVNGCFTVTLDFGSAFDGNARWLEIGVRTNGSGAFATLTPRQPLTPSPYAIYTAGAGTAATASTATTAASANAVAANAVPNAGLQANAVTSDKIADGTIVDADINAATGISGSKIIGGDLTARRLQVGVGHTLTGDLATIAGGSNNVASGDFAVVGGGWTNTALQNFATIGGGLYNRAGFIGTVGGGFQNIATNNFATIAGGGFNTASGVTAAIGGGIGNTASALDATVGGGENNQAAGSAAVIGGGSNNVVSADFSAISGGAANVIQAGAYSSAVVGGEGNSIQAIAYKSFLGGGENNSIQSAVYAWLGGGQNNSIQMSAYRSSLGGGYLNSIQPYSYESFLGGGYDNSIQTGAYESFLGGGEHNSIQTNAFNSFLGGGAENTASGPYSVLPGGYQNTSGGYHATVGGGENNTASGNASTVAGGRQNNAEGSTSFAAGYRAKAWHDGTFVWADATNEEFGSATNNQFLVRARNGFRLDDLTSLYFGSQVRQMLNLYDFANSHYGIGVQASTLYFRAADDWDVNGFAWYRGGTHTNDMYDSGGGVTLMTLNKEGLNVSGPVIATGLRAGTSLTLAGNNSTITGGSGNMATNDYTVISGGFGNRAGGYAAAIAGGRINTADGDGTFVGGGQDNHAQVLVSTIGGGLLNVCSNNAFAAVISGGENNTATGWRSAILGGYRNTSSGYASSVAGGEANTAQADFSFIGGGLRNLASAYAATISGGSSNEASGISATVSGGSHNRAWWGGSVGGGEWNDARLLYTCIAGGVSNTASGQFASVAGGRGNTASGTWATVAGGDGNTATYDYCTAGGGINNSSTGMASTIAGGYDNNAWNFAAVGGGYNNSASGTYATVPGGIENAATGSSSMAAGYRAQALHSGAFVWADSSQSFFASTASDQFLIRASGNVGINKNNPATALDVSGTVTATSFSGSGSGLTGIPTGAIADNSVTSAKLASDAASLTKVSGARLDSSSGPITASTNLYLANNDLRLRSNGDYDHGLGYYGTYAGSGIDGPVLYGYGGGTLAVHKSGGAGTTNGVLFWKDTLNVGIGTASPGTKLDVRGDLTLDPGASPTLYTGTGGLELNRYLNLINSLGFPGASGLKAGGILVSDAYGYANPAKTNLIVKGWVGIGTASPDATLTVNGTADKPGGGSWGTFSDARLKDVGDQFTHGLKDLAGIQPVHYHYKADNPLNLPSQSDYVGLVAQQVRQAIPEAVNQNKDGYLVLNNDPIIWTMLNAIKELNQKVENKDAENAELKKRLGQLEQLVHKLAAK